METITCTTNQSNQRRSATYKPNIWKQQSLLQSLASEYADEKHKREAERLIEVVRCMFSEAMDHVAKLELIDGITKLGLANHFEHEIREALTTIRSFISNSSSMDYDLCATSLCFRLLRQYGYTVSEDLFLGFMDSTNTFISSATNLSIKAYCELFEASMLASEEENILKEAKLFSSQYLTRISEELDDEQLAMQVNHTLDLPSHFRVGWYNVRKNIYAYDQKHNANSSLLSLAKLNFNMVQAVHQKDLKELTLRWWKNLGITEKLSFTRDRVVESFLWATGVAYEPQHGKLRKWMAKVIQFVLIIDDVYDIYGSLQELEEFTNAIVRWDPNGVQQLPECMSTCSHMLFDITEEIAMEIQKETGWDWVLNYLHNAWADFCKSLLLEAKWDHKGCTPSLQEYLSNGWISSSGPLIALHVILGVSSPKTKEALQLLESSKEIVYYTSLIIRLCNDQGTSQAELERGDAPSSILCYMREANVSEGVARERVKGLTMDTWTKINSHLISLPQEQQLLVKYIVNTARVAHCIYQHGDGFGVQDRETRDQVLSNLIQPIATK